MTDEAIDELVAQAAIVTDDHLDDPHLEASAIELCDDLILMTQHEEAAADAPVTHLRRVPRRRMLAAAAVLVATLGLASTFVRGGSSVAWAAPLVAFAESSPQLLLDQDGGSVGRADQYGGEMGEMTFVNGDRSADLFWRVGSFQGWVDDRTNSAAITDSGTALGADAVITSSDNEYSALWQEGYKTLEFRTQADKLDGFEALLNRLRRTDVDGWLSAMPDSVIQSAQRGAVIDEMLIGIPLPDGLDLSHLRSPPVFRTATNWGRGSLAQSDVHGQTNG